MDLCTCSGYYTNAKRDEMRNTMKIMIKILLGLGMMFIIFNAMALNSSEALKSFRSELENIRTKLQSGKMSATQAEILLSALQVRQNNVLIAQNEEILQRLAHESK